MTKRIGAMAMAIPAFVLAVLLLAPEVDAFRRDGWTGLGGYGVEAVTFPLSHTTTTPPTSGAPVITSFTPTSGPPLSYVQITGANFTGVTSVTFGGVPSDKFVFFPNSGVALVPLSALTGPISVANASGTGVSHDNFTVAGLIVGGSGLTTSFSSTGGPSRVVNLGWGSGNAPIPFYVIRTDLTGGEPAVAIGPLPISSYEDTKLLPDAFVCYVVTQVFETVTLGVSDLECVALGMSTGSQLEPSGFNIGLRQSNTAYLAWRRTMQVVDAHVLAILPTDGSPASHVVFPPDPFNQSYQHDTRGVPTCFLVLGMKIGPPFEYGMTNLLCGVPGVSTLGGSSLSADELTQGVGQALAGLKLPDLRETVQAAAGQLAPINP